MGNPERLLEREIEAVEEAKARGDLSSDEALRQIMDLQRDYRDAAREAAQDAYERELEQW